MSNKTVYHPNGTAWIKYREEPHTYTDSRGVRYLSGTSLIKPFFPKFDAETISVRCSQGNNPKYAGRDPYEIRQEWLQEGRRGSREGDNLHEYVEAVLAGWDQTPEPISDRCKELFVQADRAIKALFSKNFVFVAAEVVIFSPSLEIAGMIDLLMYDPATNEILILDWKQNKEITRDSFRGETANPPIDHLKTSDISKYGLQLSTYQYILEQEGYFPDAAGYRRGLVHITPENFFLIPLDYYEFEVEAMLATKREATR